MGLCVKGLAGCPVDELNFALTAQTLEVLTDKISSLVTLLSHNAFQQVFFLEIFIGKVPDLSSCHLLHG